MVEPTIIPRAEHPLSRRDIDPDALKVLNRLRSGEYVAYLVGGSVRDLLLGRRPKDFDIGTSAHPYQVKKLFRNCWIIGRRFRLAHVKFGNKVIEVATFRRQVAPGEEIVQDGVPAPDPTTPEGEQLIHHDNTFGTPEEDAFRRDFTINALFYDIATFSIIDYVGGLADLRAGVVRAIGDPGVRMREDPVRMLRAVALAARLDFRIDQPMLDAIRENRHEIAKSAPPRMLEEYYKILRNGAAEKTFRMLAELGLLEPISHELHRGATEPLWKALAAIDAYRHGFQSAPDTLTNAVLMGTLLTPLGIPLYPQRQKLADGEKEPRHPPLPKLGELPLARRDVEKLRQLVQMQRRLLDIHAHPRGQHGLLHRSTFHEALTWLEIHGHAPDVVAHWKALIAEAPQHPAPEHPAPPGAPEHGGDAEGLPRKRRRRRRRRRHGNHGNTQP
jgi:poly(A) polymerase